VTHDFRDSIERCIFEFDCITPGCDGVADRLRLSGIELADEVERVRCRKEPAVGVGCGQQLRLVDVNAEREAPAGSAIQNDFEGLVSQSAEYADVQRAVRRLLGP